MNSISTDEIDFSEMISGVVDDFTPSLKICNETPDDWGAVIIDIGIKYIFQNWTDKPNDNVGGNVNMPTGSCRTFRSRTNACCAGWFVLAKVRDANNDEHLVSKSYNVENDTSCFVYDELILGPASTRQFGRKSSDNGIFEFRTK